MVKTFMALFAVFLALAMAGIWFLRPPAALSARFAHAECRRIELSDPDTGRPVIGPEDLALAPNGDTVIVSAHDRRDAAMPDGGLFALSIWALGAGGPVDLRRLDAPRRAGAVFRPHGIALSPDGARLAVINRTGEHEAVVETGRLSAAGWQADKVYAAPRLCSANDLDFAGGGTIRVTLDRADCHRSLRDLAPWSRTGAVIRIGPGTGRIGYRVERSGLGFANGLSGDVVAETRRRRLAWTDGRTLALPGGPDNLTRLPDGDLIVALHPNLLRLGLVLGGWLDAAPSRIVRIDPDSGAIEVLFDDPEGRVFSAASAAVMAGGSLVIGSATERGLLLCGDGA